MSFISPGQLKTVTGSADLATLNQYNFEKISSLLLIAGATPVNDVANTLIGPPTTGDHVLNEKWRDSLGGEWVCIAAGTPGTWVQTRPALVAADPGSGTIPTGYRIWRTDLNYRERRHTGAYAWEEVYGSGAEMDAVEAVNAAQNLSLARLEANALTGGAAGALDAIATVSLSAGVSARVVAGGVVYQYDLVAGTDAENSPSVIRPDDYGGGNQKFWRLVSVSAASLALSGKLTQTPKSIAASEIDWALGNTFEKTIAGNETFTFANPVAGQWINVKITNGGAHTVTWPTVSWKGGVTPTQTVSATDFYRFYYDGTEFFGVAEQDF